MTDPVRPDKTTLHASVGSSGSPPADPRLGGGGAIALPNDPLAESPSLELSYESGVELKARSQWAYARIRFFRHRLAVASLVVLILVAFVAIFAKQIAPYGYDELDLENIAASPTLAVC